MENQYLLLVAGKRSVAHHELKTWKDHDEKMSPVTVGY